MVQRYNPNVAGSHILSDIKNVDGDKIKIGCRHETFSW